MATTARKDAEEAKEAFEEYVEKVGEEALVVAESAVAAPVELGFTLFAEFSALFTIIMVGVVWVLLWTATVYVNLRLFHSWRAVLQRVTYRFITAQCFCGIHTKHDRVFDLYSRLRHGGV